MINASHAIDQIQDRVELSSDISQLVITNHQFYKMLLESRSTTFNPKEYLVLIGAYLATAQIMSLLDERFKPTPLSRPINPDLIEGADLDVFFDKNAETFLNPARS